MAESAWEDDVALLGALRDGDAEAFEFLVRHHSPRLLSAARRLLGNEQDAQDALQEAFLAALAALDGFRGEARLSTWLHRILVNACLMRLRGRSRRAEQPIEDLLPRFLEDGHHAVCPSRWQPSAEALVERREIREFVRGCIDQLPESHRTVLLLRDIEDLDTAETARLLGIDEGAVKTRLHRARQALRSLLEPRLRRGFA
ncbi:MAG: sigma-70 family RNA polymerase sigma factor [Vicinamibacteria bacterium]|nr:sigma-70 family RNA polymerase sigma factor [Vicinamibacteria bacterium]